MVCSINSGWTDMNTLWKVFHLSSNWDIGSCTGMPLDAIATEIVTYRAAHFTLPVEQKRTVVFNHGEQKIYC